MEKYSNTRFASFKDTLFALRGGLGSSNSSLVQAKGYTSSPLGALRQNMASGSRPMHTSRPLSSPVANRPLSPHLPLKKPQLSATFSISPYFRCCIGRCHHSHPSIHQVQRNVWCLSRIVPLLASTYSGSLKVIKFKAQNWLGALMDIQTIHMFFVLTKLIKVRVLMALDDMEDRRWYQNLATGTLVSFSSAWRC